MRAGHLALLLCLLAAFNAPSAEAQCSQRARSSGQARPIAVLLEHSVWFGLVDLPLFILYEDGRVIYPEKRDHGVPVSYRQARIDPSTALERLGINDGFRRLRERYDFRPNWSDQETVFLFTWCGNTLKRVAVRAGMVDEDRFSDQVPVAFRKRSR